MLLVPGGYTRAIVPYRERGAAVTLRGDDQDARPGRRVPNRVLDQDAADLEDALLVREGHERTFRVDDEHVVGALGDGAKLLADRSGRRRDVDRRARDGELPRVEARQIEEVRGELRQAVHLRGPLVDEPPPFLRAEPHSRPESDG